MAGSGLGAFWGRVSQRVYFCFRKTSESAVRTVPSPQVSLCVMVCATLLMFVRSKML